MDVYKIGISLTLVNGVSSVLALIQSGMEKLNRTTKEANANLGRLKMAATGLFAVGVGGAIFKGLDDLTKQGDKYVHQIEQMTTAGMLAADQSKAIAEANRVASSVMTTTPTENLEVIRELRMALASADVRPDQKYDIAKATDEAISHLETVQKITAILASLNATTGRPPSEVKESAYELTKATEILGLSLDPKKFDAVLEGWTQSMVASGGKLTGRDFFQTVKYLRGAGSGMSIDFLTNIMPSLMQEMKTAGGSGQGGGAGNPLASLFAEVVGGTAGKKTIEALRSIHMLNEKRVVREGRSGERLLPGAIVGADIESQNPFQFMKEVIEPHLKKYTNLLDKNAAGEFLHPGELRGMLFQLFPNRTAQQIANMMMFQSQRILADKALKEGAWPISPAFQELIRHDPYLARLAFAKQFERVEGDLGKAISPTVTEGIYQMAKALSSIAEVIEAHPLAAKYALISAASIAGLLTVLGSIGVVAAAISMVVGGPAILMFGTMIIGIGTALAYLAERFNLFSNLSLPSLSGDVFTMINDVMASIARFASTGPGMAGSAIMGAGGIALDFGSAMLSYIRASLPSWAAAVDRGVLAICEMITQGMERFGALLRAGLPAYRQMVVNVLMAIGGMTAGLGSAMLDSANKLEPVFISGIMRLQDIAAVYFPIWGRILWDGIKLLFSNLIKMIIQIGPMLSATVPDAASPMFAKFVTDFANVALRAVRIMGGLLISGAGVVFSDLRAAYDAHSAEINKFLRDSLVALFRLVVRLVIEAVQLAFRLLVALATESGKEAVEGFKALGPILKSAVASLATDLKTYFSERVAAIKEVFSALGTAYVDALSTLAHNIANWVKSLPGMIWSSIVGKAEAAPAASPLRPFAPPPSDLRDEIERYLHPGLMPGPGAPPLANDNRGTKANPLVVWVDNQVNGGDIARGVFANGAQTLRRPPSGVTAADPRVDPLWSFYGQVSQ